ncbi:MAG: trypsin-like serine protease [Chloroflexi bacterium]|nr:trypsin-like serine protease [Chloroflexota bacterium]
MRNAIPYDVIPTDGIMSQSAPGLGVPITGVPGWTPSIPPDGWADPLVSGAAGTIPAPTPTNAYVTDYVPTSDIHTFPYNATGKVYFVMNGRNYVCSGSVIGENTIWTAGHCVSNGQGTFHTNWLYVPVFNMYTSIYPGPWLASYYITTFEFARNVDLTYDYAIVGVRPPWVTGGNSIRHYTGALGFAWNMPRAQNWKLLGYPQLIFDGVRMVYSDSTYWADNPRFTPASVGVGSNFKSGSSGGPWILNFAKGQAGQINYMNGTNSYISSIADEIYSPYFDDHAKALWDCSQTVTPNLDFNCFAGDAANNLTLIYTPSSDPLTPGAPFAYTIGIHNPSLAAATTIVLDVSMPVPVTSADLPGGACVVNGSAVQCALASLAAGGTANVALSVNAPSASAYSVITTARVKFDQQVVWDYQTSFETKIACSNTITVANTNDSGAGSLRQALVDACVSGTINFDPSLSGATIRLSSQLEPASVTIDGSVLASRLTISGDTDGNGTGDTRVFSAMNVTFDSLIITQGNAGVNDGGGISGNGITVKNCILSENRAANGGGIFSGYLVLANSIFSGNSATGDGGGVYADSSSTFSIANSTFSANSAAGNGGGIYVQGNKDAEVANSSFSGNTASNGGGLYAAYGSLVNLVNDTFSANSASVSGGGTFIDTNTNAALSYANTIIANSTGGGDCYIVNGGTPGVNLNNLVEDGSCAAALTRDPKLGALTGSPAYFPLNGSSPAIDAGDDAVCAAAPVSNTSQNGLTRPQGAHCDIGSVEALRFLLYLPLVIR